MSPEPPLPPSAEPSPPPAEPPKKPERLASIDAYRGLVMFLMMAEALRCCEVAKALPESGLWAFLCRQQSHVQWVGCTLHDLIQPSFSFLVGVALPFSLAGRASRGESFAWSTVHAFYRALVLILLGVFLRSMHSPQTNWTFDDTLTQIGMGYGFLFLLGHASVRTQWIAFAGVLIGYWAIFALYPLPGAGFSYAEVGVPPEWLKEFGQSGFAAHWEKNSNAAWAFDRWWMNLFPRPTPWLFHKGGYATLSFIPTLATMILGLLAGGVLRSDRTPWRRIGWFVAAGVIGLASGWLLHAAGLCPLVKRIWTPSWVLYSGGWCFLFLAAFYASIDVSGRKAWAFPLVVIGANSIAAYCLDHVAREFISGSFKIHFGKTFFQLFGAPYEPFFTGVVELSVLWLVLLWMYRRKIFLKV